MSAACTRCKIPIAILNLRRYVNEIFDSTTFVVINQPPLDLNRKLSLYIFIIIRKTKYVIENGEK